VKRLQLERDFLKKSSRLLCSAKQPYELIEAESCANFPITLMGEVLEVSKSGYYAWCNRPTSPRKQENERLSQQIRAIHQQRRHT
jgi:putative transposase